MKTKKFCKKSEKDFTNCSSLFLNVVLMRNMKTSQCTQKVFKQINST